MFRLVVPPCYVPEGDSPLSLYATVLSSKVVLASVSRHRAGKGKEEEEDQGGRVRKPIKCLTSLRMPLSTSRCGGLVRPVRV